MTLIPSRMLSTPTCKVQEIVVLPMVRNDWRRQLRSKVAVESFHLVNGHVGVGAIVHTVKSQVETVHN